MRREIGTYTVEATGDLITINERDAGTVWGSTFPIGQIRKHFTDVCNRVETKVYGKQGGEDGISKVDA
jgi:hypothetical protein